VDKFVEKFVNWKPYSSSPRRMMEEESSPREKGEGDVVVM
jgi:hypothetical protein